jgi:hypothetical protein
MAVIAFIAVDLAALRATLPRIPNPGLAVMTLVLEAGLFRVVSRQGGVRDFWLGFEVAGWAYVITCSIFAWTAWRLARSLFERCVLGNPIDRPIEMDQFVLFAGSLQLLISLAIALLAGILARSVWHRRAVVNPLD